jgi:hypothetical protein
MFHPRKYAIAFVGSDSRLTRLCASRLSLAEAAEWLDSHGRAPSPDGQPCILLHPIAPAICAADAQSRTG